MIGDSGVGKSCLVQRFSRNEFPSDHIATIGIDYEVKTIDIDNRKVKLQLWDTAGMERFRTITYAYYRGAHGIILVYDTTDEMSFFNVRTWMNNIHSHAQNDVCKILVGNKVDITENRRVSTQRGQEMAKEYDIPYFETSAMTGENVQESMMTLIREVIQKHFPSTDEGIGGGIKDGTTKDITVDVTTQSEIGFKKCSCQIL